MILSQQEIRNALYGGECSALLNELAEMRCFKNATGWSVKSLRMEDKELVLRFVAFLIRDYRRYNKSVNPDTWLGDTMMIYNAMPSLDNRDIKKLVKEGNVAIEDITVMAKDAIIESFEKAMTRGQELFGPHAFRKSIPGNRRAPINKSLFEYIILFNFSYNVIYSFTLFFGKLRSKRFECFFKHHLFSVSLSAG